MRGIVLPELPSGRCSISRASVDILIFDQPEGNLIKPNRRASPRSCDRFLTATPRHPVYYGFLRRMRTGNYD
jgi:hypothetical protein